MPDMAKIKLFGFLIAFLVLVALSSAATCSEKAYSNTCNKCDFDKDGKLNQTCYEKYQGSGVACLFAAYPIEAIEYQSGNCPAIDVCKARLEDCKAIYSSNNDRTDCYSNELTHCFIRADNCVALATKNCSGTPPGDISDIAPPASMCDDLFYFVALFAGTLFYRHRH